MKVLFRLRRQYLPERPRGAGVYVDGTKVRDAIRLVESDGWRLVRTRGSHRHYHHSIKITTRSNPGLSQLQGILEKNLIQRRRILY